jgi:putative transposase
VSQEVRDLIWKRSRKNPLWGAPRIHGELLKLGFDIGETSVSKYMVRTRKPPSRTWRTFLDNHVRTTFPWTSSPCRPCDSRSSTSSSCWQNDRRRIVHFNVTAHPTAEWTAQQRREAFPFDRSRGIYFVIVTASLAVSSAGMWRP